MHQSALIEDLAIILCVAGIVTVLFQKIKQPTVLGYLIAGIIIGPYTPPFSFIDDMKDIQVLAELGVIFLMFSLGLEFNYRKLTRIGFSAIIIAVFEVLFMIVIGYLAGGLLGWSSYDKLLLGAALAISSTTIIIKALEDLNLKQHFFAELMVGVLLVEDLLAILLMVFVSSSISPGNVYSTDLFLAIVKPFVIISSWFLIGYLIVPTIMRKIQNYINYETLTIISTGLCLFLSSVAVYFHYSAALGGFIMGLILAETPQVQKIEALTLPIRDIFAAVFFVSVGMLIDPMLIITYFPYVLLLSLITIVGKILTSAFGAVLSGQSVATSLRLGFSMAQIGEFSFIIIGFGGTMYATNATLYPIVVAISAITTFATPYLMKFGGVVSDKVEQKMPVGALQSINNYIDWTNTLGAKQDKKVVKRNDMVRFLVNAIIVAIILTAFNKLLSLAFIAYSLSSWLQPLLWLCGLFLATPFIWAMMFANHSEKIQIAPLRVIAWILTISELISFTLPHFSFPILFLLFALIALYIRANYNSVRRSYFWLEAALIKNITEQAKDEALFQKLAPWNYEMFRLKVLSHFPFIGQTLEECKLRPAFGINIIAIKRNSKTIFLPSAKERILPNDELVLLGDRKEVDQFRDFYQKIEQARDEAQEEELALRRIEINENHILVNRSLSDSHARQELQGLIIGIERKGERILNPHSSTVLRTGDVLLLVENIVNSQKVRRIHLKHDSMKKQTLLKSLS